MALSSRQQQILDAALDVIDRQGIQQFTMKNLAQAVGVTDAALYKHFPDKAAILSALAELFKDATLKGLRSLLERDDLSALGKLREFLFSRAEQFQKNRALTVTLFSEELFRGLGPVRSLNNDAMIHHSEQLVAVAAQGQDLGEIRSDVPAAHLILMLQGSMRAIVTSWKNDPNAPPALIDRVKSFWSSYQKLVQRASN